MSCVRDCGGCFVRNATACQAPTSRSDGLQATRRTARFPARSPRSASETRATARSASTRAETVERPPPPCVGTQPSNGWNELRPRRRRDGAEQRVPRRRRTRLTGAPSRPSKTTRTSREVTCASRPPTMLLPPGQVSRYCVVPCAGTTTHGPGTRMHDWMPWHSFVAPPAGANEAAAASATTIAAEALSREPPEPYAREERTREHEHDAATRGDRRDLDGLVCLPTRDPSSEYVLFTSTLPLRENWPPLDRAIGCSTAG